MTSGSCGWDGRCPEGCDVDGDGDADADDADGGCSVDATAGVRENRTDFRGVGSDGSVLRIGFAAGPTTIFLLTGPGSSISSGAASS